MLPHTLRSTLLALYVAGQSSIGFAAEVFTTQDTFGKPLIEIRGEIQRGDLLKVERAAIDVVNSQQPPFRRPLLFHVNTAGGDITEAIKIGRFFRHVLAHAESYGKIVIAKGGEDEQILILSKGKSKDRDYAVLPIDAPLSEALCALVGDGPAADRATSHLAQVAVSACRD